MLQVFVCGALCGYEGFEDYALIRVVQPGFPSLKEVAAQTVKKGSPPRKFSS